MPRFALLDACARMLASWSSMSYTAAASPLTTTQQCVANALAAGATVSAAAHSHGLNRVTVYRWMKQLKPFQDALYKSRAEFILDRRDKLYYLTNRALNSLESILDKPNSSPAVKLRAAMFILTRPIGPKIGWTMPEPAPPPGATEILSSDLLEEDFGLLPGLSGIEHRDDAAECNIMQQDSPVCEDVALAAEAPAESASSVPQFWSAALK
jgi:hypothetical protein